MRASAADRAGTVRLHPGRPVVELVRRGEWQPRTPVSPVTVTHVSEPESPATRQRI